MFFYCRSYCLFNMFQAPLCPLSGAREYYTVGCCLWYLVLWFSSCRYGVELRVLCPVCGLLLQQPANRTHNPQLHTVPTTWKQAPNTTGSNHLYNTLELLMMGIMVPETCWASNKICNKNSSVASSCHFISTRNKTLISTILPQAEAKGSIYSSFPWPPL
jgi:hypothetical protein